MRLSLLLGLALLAGCNGKPAHQSEPVANGSIAAEASTASPPAAVPPAVSYDRLDGVKVGDSLADLKARGFTVTDRDQMDPANPCGYARLAERPEMFLMLDSDKVARIDVRSPDYPLGDRMREIRVGMTEAAAKTALGDAVRVQPHPYTGPEGHYLVVHGDGAPYGLILETDGKAVTSYRIGRWEQVQWIEGCA